MNESIGKFAHLADCHIGGWKEGDLQALSIKSFDEATKRVIEEQVDFLIIAGDLFNTSIPSVEAMKQVTLSMRQLKDAKIPVYIIAGSHDFSPSGKTMLDVLENAGLCKNVFVYNKETKKLSLTEHKLKDGTTIFLTGVPGFAGGLEKSTYEELSNKEELEQAQGIKLFLFHTLLTELKPTKGWEQVPSEPLGLLPKNFNYYAGGHPHFVSQKSTADHPLVTYPGPLFPNNFKELEDVGQGGFYIGYIPRDGKITLEHKKIHLKNILKITINAEEKTAEEIKQEIRARLKHEETANAIVTLRVAGTLKAGKVADVKFKEIIDECTDAYIVLKNTSKLKAKEFSEIQVETGSIEEVEEAVIKEHSGQIEIPNLDLNNKQEELTNQLMISLNKEKLEGEKNADFESRITNDLIEIFQLKEVFENNVN